MTIFRQTHDSTHNRFDTFLTQQELKSTQIISYTENTAEKGK